MSILRRNRVKGLSHSPVYNTNVVIKPERYKNIITGQNINPHTLTLLMYDLYQQKNLKTERTQKSHYRMASKLIKKVGTQRAVELMMFAANVCKHTWTFKYLLEIAEDENVEN
jgi:hypothetical protein